MSIDLTRRVFLQWSGLTTLSLLLPNFSLRPVGAATAGAVSYRGWEDLYRKKWTWDKVVRCTHQHWHCGKGCAFKAYIKEGLVFREEQSGDYAGTPADAPDYNPRGCPMGVSSAEDMYKPSRLLYPLKRQGKRGEGKWKKVSWAEAIEDIAGKIVDTIHNHGSETIVTGSGASCTADPSAAAAGRTRFLDLLGGAFVDGDWAMSGDLQLGSAVTLGNQSYESGTCDEWFHADYIAIWACNPNYTRQPDVHFLYEARYNGTRLVTITPDYNPSSIHADLWIPIRGRTDAAFILSMCQVIVQEKLYQAAYVKEQTDLPFLVREDTQRFLRENDMEATGSDAVFYVWDAKARGLRKAPGSMGSSEKTLRWAGVDPALEGSWKVRLASGQTVRVRPVFSWMKERLQGYTPEHASKITGLGTNLIRNEAKRIAKAKAAMVFCTWGNGKLFHSDLMERCWLLLLALTGNTGKKGGGYRCGNLWPGAMPSRFFMPLSAKLRQDREGTGPGGSVGSIVSSSLPWLYYHAGMKQAMGPKEWIDPHMKKTVGEYIEEAVAKKWRPVLPAPGKDPKIYIEMGLNLLRMAPDAKDIRNVLLPKLDLMVTVDYRMSSSALWSDYVLPAAFQYEKTGVKYAMGWIPWCHFTERAAAPLGEAKDEWEIFGLLAKKVQEIAIQKGLRKYKDGIYGLERDLGTLDEDYRGGFQLKGDEEKILQAQLDMAPCMQGITVEQLKKDGIAWLKVTPEMSSRVQSATSWLEPGKPYTPGLRYTQRKDPWPTLTGRQQFYIDHARFLEFDEHLPRHKEPPKLGGNYPIRLTSGHARWSNHSGNRDNPVLLRLQRGEPVLYLNLRDAAARGIKDGDLVRVYNDLGELKVRVKLYPAGQPGMALYYHGWERYQFPGQMPFDQVNAPVAKPVNLIGDYGHLFYAMGHFDANSAKRDNVAEIEKL
ncbi:MAG: molybdopterin-dependent oxidoreductase [Candidatus Binatia bacterium]